MGKCERLILFILLLSCFAILVCGDDEVIIEECYGLTPCGGIECNDCVPGLADYYNLDFEGVCGIADFDIVEGDSTTEWLDSCMWDGMFLPPGYPGSPSSILWGGDNWRVYVSGHYFASWQGPSTPCDPTGVYECTQGGYGIAIVSINGQGGSRCQGGNQVITSSDISSYVGNTVEIDSACYTVSVATDCEGAQSVTVDGACDSCDECCEDSCVDNEKPVIKSIVVGPDPREENQEETVYYSDVFENNDLKCTIVATDDRDNNLRVDYNITIEPNGKNYNESWCVDTDDYCIRQKFSKNGTKSCTNGEECIIEISVGDIFPEDAITCTAIATDSDGESSEKGVSDVLRMPTFDLKISNVDVYNVVNGNFANPINYLTANKSHVSRVYPKFESDLITNLDKDVKFGFNYQGYEDIEGNKTIPNAYGLAYKYHTVKNYLDTFFIKAKLTKDYPVGTEEVALLSEIKRAENSVNFIGKIDTPGFYRFNANINSNLYIKESDQVNNIARDFDGKRTFHDSKIVQKQNRPVTILVYLIVHPDDISNYNFKNFQVKETVKFAKDSVDFLVALAPLVDVKIKGISILSLDYSKWAVSSGLSLGLANFLVQQRIMTLLEKERKISGADFVIGIPLDSNVMGDANGLADGWKTDDSWSNFDKKEDVRPVILLRYNPDETMTKSALVHEFGHIVGWLKDEYVKDGIDGKLIDTDGWNFMEIGSHLFQKGPRMNIWYPGQTTNNQYDAHKDMKYNTYRYGVGQSYTNIMGITHFSSFWIDAHSYMAIHDGLSSKGIFGMEK